MSSQSSPINRIGHFYDKSIESPVEMWREFCDTEVDLPICFDAEGNDEDDDLALADDSSALEGLLSFVVKLALSRNASLIEFCPRSDAVLVYYGSVRREYKAGTLPRGIYVSLLRYAATVSHEGRMDVSFPAGSVAVRVEIADSEYGQRMRIHLPRSE